MKVAHFLEIRAVGCVVFGVYYHVEISLRDTALIPRLLMALIICRTVVQIPLCCWKRLLLYVIIC